MVVGSRRPTWWAAAATRVAVRALPPGGARERWQAELVSELHGLSIANQARHTLGVIARVPALRAAVTEPGRVATPEESVITIDLRCRIRRHDWRLASTADGSHRFHECRRCGVVRTIGDPPFWTDLRT